MVFVMLETSGLMLTKNKDGSIRIEYVDYDTPLGGDFESMYDLDKSNAKKLRKLMRRKYPLLSLKRALIKEVGVNLNDSKLVQLFTLNDIQYNHFTWLS